MKLTKAALCAAALASAAPAAAANFSFIGNFTQDDNVQLFNFVVGATSNVTLRTWSYAGGVNAAGQTIARGGFDPILSLFNATGTRIGFNDDGGCPTVAEDLSERCYDTFFTASLAAGVYTVAVSQFDNFAIGPNLSDGFIRAGQGNFTPGFSNCDADQTQFEDVSAGDYCGRDSHWAFDILNVEQAVDITVPEPASWAMMIAGFGLVGSAMRRRVRLGYAAAQ